MCAKGDKSLSPRKKNYLWYEEFFLLLTKIRTLCGPSPTMNKNLHESERGVNSNINVELPRWELFLRVARNQNNTIYKTEHFLHLSAIHI